MQVPENNKILSSQWIQGAFIINLLDGLLFYFLYISQSVWAVSKTGGVNHEGFVILGSIFFLYYLLIGVYCILWGLAVWDIGRKTISLPAEKSAIFLWAYYQLKDRYNKQQQVAVAATSPATPITHHNNTENLDVLLGSANGVNNRRPNRNNSQSFSSNTTSLPPPPQDNTTTVQEIASKIGSENMLLFCSAVFYSHCIYNHRVMLQLLGASFICNVSLAVLFAIISNGAVFSAVVIVLSCATSTIAFPFLLLSVYETSASRRILFFYDQLEGRQMHDNIWYNIKELSFWKSQTTTA